MYSPDNTIKLDSRHIEELVETLNIQEIFPGSLEMVRRESLRQLLQQKLANHKRIKDNPAKPSQWDIVEPKPAKNNLRAGTTAYGRAVVLYEEGTLVSEDGKFVWNDYDMDSLIVVGRATLDQIQILNNKYGRYPIMG